MNRLRDDATKTKENTMKPLHTLCDIKYIYVFNISHVFYKVLQQYYSGVEPSDQNDSFRLPFVSFDRILGINIRTCSIAAFHINLLYKST